MPELMITSKILVEILSQITTGGVEDAMILSLTGELLAYHGKDDKEAINVITAITSNIWILFQRAGEMSLKEDEMKSFMLECTEGKVMVTKVGDFLLCLRAKENVGFGMLKKKAQILVDCFEGPLNEVCIPKAFANMNIPL